MATDLTRTRRSASKNRAALSARQPRTFAPFVAAVELSAATDGQPRSSWVQLFRTGKFWDERYGNFSLSQQDLSTIAGNFGTQTITPVDYNHGTSKPLTPDLGKAAGRIVEVEIRASGDELWGRVEWTDEAAKRIEAGEYMAMSPTFQYDYRHSDGRKMGITLLAAALTNRPVLDGMAVVEIAAGMWMEHASALRLADATETQSDEATEQIFSYDEQRRRVQSALSESFAVGTADLYGPSCGCYLLDLYDGRVIFRVWRDEESAAFEVAYTINADGTVTFTSDPMEVVNTWTPLKATPQENTMSKEIKVKDAKGVEIALSAETVAEIVKAHAPAATFDPKLVELSATVASQGETIKSLSDQNAALTLAAQKRDASAKVEGLITAGKALPVERDILNELALAQPAIFDKMAATRPTLVDLNHAVGADADRNLSGSSELTAAVQAIHDARPTLTREQAYALALEQNPKLYELAQQ